MKTKTKELDVDFIGGQNKPLSKAELAAISEFIKKRKLEKLAKTKKLKTIKKHKPKESV